MDVEDATAVRPVATTGALLVRPYQARDAARWDAFVDKCPDATFFHRIGWRGIIESVFRHRTHYLVATRGERMTGVMPLAELRSPIFGHSLVSLPFSVYGGAAAEDAESERALIDASSDLARALGVGHLELRNREVKRAAWPRQDLYVTFRKELLPDLEANMLAIPRKQRAMVRKGINAGLKSEIDITVDRFFALYADNMHRHGTPPFSKRYFARLREVFGDRCEILIVVDPSGRPVSGVMSFYFRDEVLPYYAGDITDAREFSANDFKYWELMRRACERGLRIFDYGRSKRGTGSFDFKKNWGFEPSPLAYEYQLLKRHDVPQNNPLNPKYRAFILRQRAGVGDRQREGLDRMADRPPHLDDRKAAAQQIVGLVRQQVAHPLRAGPFRVVVVHARDDLADLEGFAGGIVGGAQRVVEHDDARRAGLRLHQRFHLRIVDAPHFGLVEEVRDLGVVGDEMKAVVLEREVAMPAVVQSDAPRIGLAAGAPVGRAWCAGLGENLGAVVDDVIERRLDRFGFGIDLAG